MRLPPPHAPDREAELIRLAQAGDRGARRELISGHLRFLAAVAWRHARGVEPLELLAELVIEADRAVDGFRPELGSRFLTYLGSWLDRRAAVIVGRIRGPVVVRAASVCSIDAPAEDDKRTLLDVLPAPERCDRASELVRGAIAQLPERDRDVMTARHVDGLTGREVGAKLGLTAATVHDVDRRARRALAPHLRG